MQRSDFEIMAPVGSYDSLAAAIQGGADSVYFGIEGLNMRARSSRNFTVEDLHAIVRACREHGLKSYLTVNTVLYDDDREQLHAIVDAAREAGVSAIIAGDVAAMLCARERGVEVHLSTQLNIANRDALRFYAQFADVAVLARELNLDQVKAIHKAIAEEDIRGPHGAPVRIEMFCHGALCMAVSGKCYLSLHTLNASANRGACLQVCRRSYTVRERETGEELDVENQYLLSPKDLCTVHFLDRMIDAGVRVFKIEGRARGPEYVRTVTECYNEALGAALDGTFTDERIAGWRERLRAVFNRGFWDGYYLGQRLGEWSRNYGSEATRRKVYVGKGVRYFPKAGVGEFLLETGTLEAGDEVLVTGPTTGALYTTAEEIRVDLDPVQQAVKGDRFSIRVPDKIRASDKLFKIVETRTGEQPDPTATGGEA